MPEVVVIGAVNMDIGAVSSAPLVARDSNPGRVSTSLGGVGRNIAHNLCLLGVDTAMVTALGLPGAGDLSWTTLKGLYITGVPYDAVHAASAAVFNFFFGDKVIRKLERVKLKYGIYR